MDPKELLDVAREAAERAGSLLLDHFHRPATGVEAKSTPTDLVSDADRASEALILELIGGRRPDDGVVAEEGGAERSRSGLRWIVDPLDGTVNFLFKIPAWGVSIAVEDDDGGLAGVVYDPNRGEMFAAARGLGATLNGDPIGVGDADDLGGAMIATGFSYDHEVRAAQAELLTRVLPRVRDIRRVGAATLDLVALACGRYDGFYEAPLEIWDQAAGRLIVSEAGGVVEDLPPPAGSGAGVIAAGPTLFPALRELVLG